MTTEHKSKLTGGIFVIIAIIVMFFSGSRYNKLSNKMDKISQSMDKTKAEVSQLRNDIKALSKQLQKTDE